MLVILTILIASPAIAGIFSDFDAEQRKAQIQEKIDLMKSVNEFVEFRLGLQNQA